MRQLGAILRSRAGLRLLVLCAVFFAAYASPALAADIVVTTTADSPAPPGRCARRSSTRTRRPAPTRSTSASRLAFGVQHDRARQRAPGDHRSRDDRRNDPGRITSTSPVVEIDGSASRLRRRRRPSCSATGSDGSTIRGLIISGFHGDSNGGIGIEIPSGDNTIVGNYIGTDSSGLEIERERHRHPGRGRDRERDRRQPAR